jgi:anti-sigma B factor antagonist
MSMPAGNLMIGVFDHCVCIKVQGRANFVSGVDLKKVMEKLLGRGNGNEVKAEEAKNRLILDLRECVTMDSTFLGVLSGIGVEYSKPPFLPVKLANMPGRISDLIEGLGISHLFDVCTEDASDETKFQPCAKAEVARSDVTRTCLAAHEMLMAVNPNNVAKFKDVTRFLSDDLQKQVAAEKAGTNGHAGANGTPAPAA